MTKPDYSQFDALLIDQIKQGKNTMKQLDVPGRLLELAKPFCTPQRYGYPQPEWRVIDRRLQALRRAGKIRFGADGSSVWSITE